MKWWIILIEIVVFTALFTTAKGWSLADVKNSITELISGEYDRTAREIREKLQTFWKLTSMKLKKERSRMIVYEFGKQNPHYFPEVKNLVGPHQFGFNKKSHMQAVKKG